MIAVCGGGARYRAAIAELAATARTASDPREAVCVVGGARWWEDARAVLDAGAAALVIEHPVTAPRDALARIETLAGTRPIIAERRHLRDDVIAGLLPNQLRALAVEAVSGDDLELLRDVLGWIRVLARGTVRIAAAEVTAGRVLAALGTRMPDAPRAPSQELHVALALTRHETADVWARITGIGADRLEIVVTSSPRSPMVTLATSQGRTLVTRPREGGARRALQRAAAALDDGSDCRDIDQFRADDECARALIATAPEPSLPT